MVRNRTKQTQLAVVTMAFLPEEKRDAVDRFFLYRQIVRKLRITVRHDRTTRELSGKEYRRAWPLRQQLDAGDDHADGRNNRQ